MEKIKAARYPGRAAFASLINRFETPASVGCVKTEIYPLDEIEAEVEKAHIVLDTAQKRLSEIIDEAKKKISENSERIKKDICEAEKQAQESDNRRKLLIRASMDECDSKKKEAIDREVLKLRSKSADCSYRAELLKEKLDIASCIPPNIETKLNEAIQEADNAEQIVFKMKHDWLESLDSRIYELVSKSYEIIWDLTDRRDFKVERLLKSSGLMSKIKGE